MAHAHAKGDREVSALLGAPLHGDEDPWELDAEDAACWVACGVCRRLASMH